MSEHDEEVGENEPVDAALEAAIGRLATREVTVTDDRLSAIEQRILSATDGDRRAAGAAMLGAGVGGSVTPLRRFRSVTLVAAACLIAFFAVSVSLLGGGDDGLVIAAADEVVVELPDGEELVGRSGTDLPEGSRLEVIGFVTVDGETFGPGSYVVIDGQIMIESSRGPDVGVDAPALEPAKGEPEVPATVVADDRTDGDGDGAGDDDVDDERDRPVAVATTEPVERDRPVATDNGPTRTVPTTQAPEVTRPPTTREPEPTRPPSSAAPAPDATRPPGTSSEPVRTSTTVDAATTTIRPDRTLPEANPDPVRDARDVP